MTDKNRDELIRLREQVANSPEYKAGTKAFYDAHSVVFPCTVMEVIEEGNGVFVTSGKLRIRCDKDTGPYKKGEEMEVTGFHCFPKNHRRIKDHKYTINKWYRWVK